MAEVAFMGGGTVGTFSVARSSASMVEVGSFANAGAARIGGKYPSDLCVEAPGDMLNGTVSRRLVGKPLIVILDWRSLVEVYIDGLDGPASG